MVTQTAAAETLSHVTTRSSECIFFRQIGAFLILNTHAHTIQSPPFFPFTLPYCYAFFSETGWNGAKSVLDLRLPGSSEIFNLAHKTTTNMEHANQKYWHKGGAVTWISWISWYTLGFGFPPLLVTLTMRRLSFSLSDTKISRYISYWTSIWSLPLRFKWIVNPAQGGPPQGLPVIFS